MALHSDTKNWRYCPFKKTKGAKKTGERIACETLLSDKTLNDVIISFVIFGKETVSEVKEYQETPI